MAIVKNKMPMPSQTAEESIKNFNEVPLGYTDQQAVSEASRCLQCKDALCVGGCPVEIDIPGFIKLIAEKDFSGAARKLKEKNSLPGICGRVCPQEDQCEKVCILGKKHDPVGIGNLERFAADYEQSKGKIEIPEHLSLKGKNIAVIGSGPSGLTLASELSKLGFRATIYEALHEPGGVLVYGIPEFRLPKAIVAREVEYIQKLGVEIKLNYVIGKIHTIDELFKIGYSAVYIGIGAGLPMFMNITGENLNGVYSANEFLTRSNLMRAHDDDYDTPIMKGRRYAVIGGGNVAMDSARTAVRLGAEKVYNVYRRSRAEMPARIEEVPRAEKEGVILQFLTNPVRIVDDGKGWVKAIECIRMELGEPDESGRKRPVPVKGSEFIIDVDVVIMAIGTRSNPLLASATPDMKLNKWGYIIVNEATGETSKKNVYAGGDIVTGSATVISAMGAAKKIAKAIDESLK